MEPRSCWSVDCDGVCDAAAKPGLAYGVQDFGLGLLEHADHVGEGGPDVGVGIPAARHDLTQHRQAVRRDYRSHVSVLKP